MESLEAVSTNREGEGAVVVELRHFRGQQEGLGNKRRLISKKTVEALENPR